MNTVSLPWPPKELSPNARVHWAKLAKAKKQYRQVAFWLAKEAKLQAPAKELIRVDLTFFAPTKHARDRDNLLASMKAGLDGLADALGIDDQCFDPKVHIAEQTGCTVQVRLS